MTLLEKVKYMEGIEKMINDVFGECEEWEACNGNDDLLITYEKRMEEMEHDFLSLLPDEIKSLIVTLQCVVYESVGGAGVTCKLNYNDGDCFNIDYIAEVEF